MEALQQFFSRLLGDFAAVLPFGYAFGAGMVSAVNPCGFAMLPAYLGLYLGSRDFLAGQSNQGTTGRAAYEHIRPALVVPMQLARAFLVALVVITGFVVLFAIVGIALSSGGRLIVEAVPWVALSIGVVLVLLGLGMLAGHHLPAGFAARIAQRVGDPASGGLKGYFLFGVAYAVASLSCTLPIFLTVVGGSLTASGFASATGHFVSYALGMGLIILMLTMSIAMFKGALMGAVRKVLPYFERVSALLMILAGSYIVYYWLFKGGLIHSLG